jgi:uncharacterized BrkB/YihY/UPF0761 family membrane protein
MADPVSGLFGVFSVISSVFALFTLFSVLLTLLFLVVFLVGLVFEIWMIIDCVKRKSFHTFHDNAQIIWILLIVFTPIFAGTLLYYFLEKRKDQQPGVVDHSMPGPSKKPRKTRME